MNGVRKTQRKRVIPRGTKLPFGAGNQAGSAMPICRKVEAKAANTNTDTMPFQNKVKKSNPNAVPRERCVAPMTAPLPSRWNQTPSGGRLTSMFSSTIVPEVSADRLWERLQFRQNAMSLATLISSLGIVCLQRGHIGVTDIAETAFSSSCCSIPPEFWLMSKIKPRKKSVFCARSMLRWKAALPHVKV